MGLVLGGLVAPVSAQPTPGPDSASTSSAVPTGTLMIVGGNPTPSLYRRFVALAGGRDAEVVCVPTALPLSRLVGWCEWFFRRTQFRQSTRTILHTRDSVWADTEAFVAPLKTADAVWFTGGRQWRLVKTYGGTKTEEAFWDVLVRGGVIGGSSAGASIQGSFLVRGDPKSKKIVVGKYTEGFGFLPNSAIDQHLLARNRTYDLIPVVEKRPRLLGLGIAEQTAALAHGDTLRVLGRRRVAVYDARRWQQADEPLSKDEKVLFLHPGDQFNLETRTVLPFSSRKGEEDHE